MYLSIFPKVVSYSEKIIKPKFANSLLGLIGAGYGAIGIISTIWFHDNIANNWATEQAEYRADKMVIEKLIELNELDPIAYKLIWLRLVL